MYLQDIAERSAPSGANADGAATDLAVGADAKWKPDMCLRVGVSLLIASGAVLGVINLLVMIRLVAVALGA